MKEIDLIIIGSGSAGISTALHLVQQDPGWAVGTIANHIFAQPEPLAGRPPNDERARPALKVIKD